jgi:hypothetical protein
MNDGDKEINDLAQEWTGYKAAEKFAVERRREIEDRMVALMRVKPDAEGTTSVKTSGYVVKAVSRLDRKIDADKLHDAAIEAGLYDQLKVLFRWEPKVNVAIWKQTSEDVTGPLSVAITTVPGRPSFTIQDRE